MNIYADMLYFLHELISKYGIDKRILTTKFQFYTNVNLKLFHSLSRYHFFKKDHLRRLISLIDFLIERSVLTSIQNWSDDLFFL